MGWLGAPKASIKPKSIWEHLVQYFGPFPGGWRSEAVGHHSAADEELGVCTSH